MLYHDSSNLRGQHERKPAKSYQTQFLVLASWSSVSKARWHYCNGLHIFSNTRHKNSQTHHRKARAASHYRPH